MNAHALVDVTRRIEELARELGERYRELSLHLADVAREAFQKGGTAGASDVANVIGPPRVAEEVAGCLVAAGLEAVLAVGHSAPPISDLSDRWRRRIEHGQLTTKRTLDKSPPGSPPPGQTSLGTGTRDLPKPTLESSRSRR